MVASMEISKEASPSESSMQPSSNLPVSGGNDFLSHRMSADIESIVQGFKFAAAGRKPPGAVAGETVGLVKGNGKARERLGGNDTFQNKIDYNTRGQEKLGIEAMKMKVPVFSATTMTPSLHYNPLNSPITSLAETSAPREKMLPPPQALHLIERGRKTIPQQIPGTEKRKRTQSSGSFQSDSERDRSDNEGMMPREDAQRGHMAASTHGGNDYGGRGKVASVNDGRVVETNSKGGERRPRKRPERLPETSKPQNQPLMNSSSREKSSPEIIILDDDTMVEKREAEVPKPDRPRTRISHNGHNSNPISVHGYGKYRRDKNISINMDQPPKHPIPLSKTASRQNGVVRGLPEGIISSSGTHTTVRSERVIEKTSTNNRPSMGDNETPKNGRTPLVSNQHAENHLRQPNHKTSLPPHRPRPHEEPDQSSTSEHKLLMALTALTTEKQSLENKLRESISSFNAQVLRNEASEKRNTELKNEVKTYKDAISGLKKRVAGVQKFVDGLGNDYNMLNEKRTHLSKSLTELSWDRNELQKNLKGVRDLAEKTGIRIQEWGDSSAILKESNRETQKLQETIKFLHNQLSENAGLLATERDRTQSLECQIQGDREKNKLILTAIQNGKTEVMQQLSELKVVIEDKDEHEIMERLAEAEKTMKTKIEADGEVTRILIQTCSKDIEKLKDRDVDATELLLGVERKISSTSTGMMDLFYETHTMNADALSYSDGYIGHLNSRVISLEAELKEIHEKYEALLIESTEKGHIIKVQESRLKDALKRCDDMSSQITRGSALEKSLNESISTLKKNINLLETRTVEDPCMVETINILKQKNHNLDKELSTARDNLQSTVQSSQAKDSEIEHLKSELDTLNLRYKEADNKIQAFIEERAGFMALAEEQMMKARIEVETNANVFRQRETSRLHNQIKSLEAQKMKLEMDNKGFRTMLAEGANVAIGLRREIQELSKNNAEIEASRVELRKGKIRLESAVGYLTQSEKTPNTTCRALEKTTADGLLGALEKINILQSENESIIGEKNLQQQELERARSERSELLTTRDITALRAAERNMRVALEKSEKEKQTSKIKNQSVINSSEVKTNAIDKALRELRDPGGGSGSISSQTKEGDSSINKDRDTERYMGEAFNGNGTSRNIMGAPGDPVNFDIRKQNPSCAATEIMGSSFTNSPSISPLTSPEPIPETQIECQVWGNSHRTVNPKSLQDLGLGRSRPGPPKRTLHDEGDDITMSAAPSEAHIETVDTGPPRNTYPEKRTLTPFTPRTGIEDIFESTVEQNSPITPGKSKNGKRSQCRSRKDRGKKNRDEQEYSGDEAETLKNNRGREESSNTKKNLKNFKDKKKGGKRNL